MCLNKRYDVCTKKGHNCKVKCDTFHTSLQVLMKHEHLTLNHGHSILMNVVFFFFAFSNKSLHMILFYFLTMSNNERDAPRHCYSVFVARTIQNLHASHIIMHGNLWNLHNIQDNFRYRLSHKCRKLELFPAYFG